MSTSSGEAAATTMCPSENEEQRALRFLNRVDKDGKAIEEPIRPPKPPIRKIREISITVDDGRDFDEGSTRYEFGTFDPAGFDSEEDDDNTSFQVLLLFHFFFSIIYRIPKIIIWLNVDLSEYSPKVRNAWTLMASWSLCAFYTQVHKCHIILFQWVLFRMLDAKNTFR